MIAAIKNGKLHTINIFCIRFIFPVLILITLKASAIYSPDGKEWVIVIDAGHGGRDPGALGSHTREKDINLAIALKTGNYIEKSLKNVKVVYTRKKDVTVDLLERPKIANENNADLFISIHTNKTSAKSVMGAETYIMGHTKDQENLEVAMKENEVIYLEEDYSTKYQGFDPKSPESYIMFTLMQNVFQKQSTDLASKIQTQFTEKVNRKDRGVKQAGFWVLFNTTMPSVLIETGFISNTTEEKFLNSEQGQDYLASAIFRACRDYMDEINSKSMPLTSIIRDTTVRTDVPEITIIPAGQITFMVQIASSKSKTEIKPENFKGLMNLSEINNQGRFKYASGRFTEYQDAVQHSKEIRNLYPDAFVIAIRDNELLPLHQALTQKKKK